MNRRICDFGDLYSFVMRQELSFIQGIAEKEFIDAVVFNLIGVTSILLTMKVEIQ